MWCLQWSDVCRVRPRAGASPSPSSVSSFCRSWATQQSMPHQSCLPSRTKWYALLALVCSFARCPSLVSSLWLLPLSFPWTWGVLAPVSSKSFVLQCVLLLLSTVVAVGHLLRGGHRFINADCNVCCKFPALEFPACPRGTRNLQLTKACLLPQELVRPSEPGLSPVCLEKSTGLGNCGRESPGRPATGPVGRPSTVLPSGSTVVRLLC